MNTTLVASLAGSAAVLGLGYWAYQRQFGWRTPFPKEHRLTKKPRGFDAKLISGSGTHGAVDVVMPKGTPILAAKRGKVTSIGYGTSDPKKPACGNAVGITHPGDAKTLYCHLDQILVKYGDEVKKGQQIGTAGATGNVVPPGNVHLHIQMTKGGKLVDPAKYIRFQKYNIASIAAWSVAAVAMSAGLVVAGRMVFE